MAWWRGAVLYQIYPRSFADGNGDGVGDLKGAAARLEHVARLGVDGIWLSPFYPSPMKDYGYDVSEYCGVDPLFGALEDFDALLAKAHGLGLKVILDQVWSHSSDAHPWFRESRASRDNPKADWYVWADAKPDGSPPNNWQALFGGPSWTWDARRRQYYLHNFLPEQPDLNVAHPPVQEALLAAARFWLDRGVDGFRLDVVNFLVHDPALADNPALNLAGAPARPHQMQRHLHDRTQPGTLPFLARLRALLDGYGDRFAVGEIEDEEPLAVQRAYTEGPDRLHSAYSFFLLRAQAAIPALFEEAMAGWGDSTGWPSWSVSNHDVVRMASRWAQEDPVRVKLALSVLLCLRGTIFLYQGDELGLPHAEVPFTRLRDPEAIAFWPHGIGRDGARTPMPWTSEGAMCGFTSAEDAWLPLDPRHRALSVEAQAQDPDSVLAFTRAMIALRRAEPALRAGAHVPLPAPAEVLAFLRRDAAGGALLCAFNLGAHPRRAALGAGLVLAAHNGARLEGAECVLPAFSALIARAQA